MMTLNEHDVIFIKELKGLDSYSELLTDFKFNL